MNNQLPGRAVVRTKGTDGQGRGGACHTWGPLSTPPRSRSKSQRWLGLASLQVCRRVPRCQPSPLPCPALGSDASVPECLVPQPSGLSLRAHALQLTRQINAVSGAPLPAAPTGPLQTDGPPASHQLRTADVPAPGYKWGVKEAPQRAWGPGTGLTQPDPGLASLGLQRTLDRPSALCTPGDPS